MRKIMNMMIATRGRIILYLAFLALLNVANTPLRAADKSIIVQSTTSTANSGLYDHLLPLFKKATGIQVNVVAVGTGQAIKNAMSGDGDVLLVNARGAEEKFVRDGFGVKRFDVMYNDFVIVGPGSDPAGLGTAKSVVEALKALASKGALFASRGDNSGTYKREIELWKLTGIDPSKASGRWYREMGSGMGATLNAAIGMGAYTLTDRGTWISFKNRGDYKIWVEGDKRLVNQYGVILVNPKKHNHVKSALGQAFVDWLLSADGQSAIASYKLNGEQLFYANAKASR